MDTEDAQNLVGRLLVLAARRRGESKAAAELVEAVTDLAERLGKDEEALRQALDDAVQAAVKTAGVNREPEAFLVETLTLLNRLAAATANSGDSRKAGGKGTRAGRPVTYFRRERDGIEYLVEHRDGSRKDFLIPRSDYDAAIAALEDVNRPMRYDALYRRFVQHGGRDIASQYPLRVILRFWMSQDPPLVEKRWARYRAAAPAEVGRLAAKTLRALPLRDQG